MNKFKEQLNTSFKELRKKGYFARQNFQCCQSCGWSMVPNEKEKEAVFYHRQDTETISDGHVYLSWAGNGYFLYHHFSQYFNVEWNGSECNRILLKEKSNLI